ncbi:17499_t:CDS:2, partial [Gigaspora margarita]
MNQRLLTAVEQQQKMYNVLQRRSRSPLLTTPETNEPLEPQRNKSSDTYMEQDSIPMELDRQKHIYKKNGQCFIYDKKGHLVRDCRIKDQNHNEISRVEKVNIKEVNTDDNKTSNNIYKRYSESDDILYRE